MASGGASVRTGAFRGTGAALNVRTVGFRPRYVRVVNITSRDEIEWFEGMADAAGVKRVAAGTGTLLTSKGITPLADGFTIGDDTDLNVAGEICHYVCVD